MAQIEDKRELKEYCEMPTSFCDIANYNCNQCPQKEKAEGRQREGRKVIDEIKRPGS
jgi:hypothetical protein